MDKKIFVMALALSVSVGMAAVSFSGGYSNNYVASEDKGSKISVVESGIEASPSGEYKEVVYGSYAALPQVGDTKISNNSVTVADRALSKKGVKLNIILIPYYGGVDPTEAWHAPDAGLTMRIQPGTNNGITQTQLTNAVVNSANKWNTAIGMKLFPSLVIGNATTTNYEAGINGYNSIGWMKTNIYPTQIAHTRTAYNSNPKSATYLDVIEVDIALNPAFASRLATTAQLEHTILHETGHAIGMADDIWWTGSPMYASDSSLVNTVPYSTKSILKAKYNN